MGIARKGLETRFWAKVRIGSPDECWEWTASRKPFGYGQMSGHRRSPAGNWVPENAHAISWQLAHGPVPAGLCVCHKCDNPPCVNPAHLFLGSQAENQHDRKVKGRVHRVQGMASPQAKLTDDAVRAIRADPRSTRAIAIDYGVGYGSIGRIKRREIWAHVA